MRRIVILTAVLGLALAGGSILLLTRNGSDAAANPSAKAAARYHCPMHPTYTSDKPGDCPICGMKLVPIDAPAGRRAEGGVRRAEGRLLSFANGPEHPLGEAGEGRHGDGLRARLRGRAARLVVGRRWPRRRDHLLRAAAGAGRAQRAGPQDAARSSHPDRRPRRGRRTPPPPRPHEVRRLRGAPLRRLHRQARAPRRATAVHLQPGAGRDPAGVPAGPSRPGQPGDERRPLRGAGEHRPPRGGSPAAPPLGHPARRHRRSSRRRGRSPEPSTCTPTSAATSWRRWRSRGCG